MPMFTFSVPVTVPADSKCAYGGLPDLTVIKAHHTRYSTWNVIEIAPRFSPLHNTTARKPLADTQRKGEQQVLPDPMAGHALGDSQQQDQCHTAMTSEQLAGCSLPGQPTRPPRRPCKLGELGSDVHAACREFPTAALSF